MSPAIATTFAEAPPEAANVSLALRDKYRPKKVVTLFVGESSPAQGTNFYLANSNLYRATQVAFAAAYGSDTVPAGEAFLNFFAKQGCWLVDLADRPVNQLPAAQRRAAVDNGVPALAETIAATKPRNVVVIKKDIAGAVEDAIAMAGVRKPQILALRYPLRQYRQEYIQQLAAFLGQDGLRR